MSPNSQVSKPIVFISYSHLDEAWKDRMLPHFKHLERLGVLEVWNDRDIGHGADWYALLKDKLEQTRFAVCLVSANFLSSRFCMEEEIPYLLQRQVERGVVVLPVLVEDCLWEAERWLSRTQMLPQDRQNLTTHFRDDPAPIFKQVAKTIYDALQPGYVAPSPAPPAGTPPEKADINRLPETGQLLFGRRDEMTLLDKAWDSDKRNVVVLKAGGGVGKSTLVRVWTKSLEQDNFRGAKRVFAWSFYSQGTGERVTSADAFIANALEWFGDPDATVGSPWDKGERLARLVAEHRTLLLLDGMEPLQSHVKEENGAITDPGLQMLVRDLARHNPGLCVISTRETVGDLTDSRSSESVVHEDLEHVSLVAGRALMRVRGVHGEDSALEATVEQFDRHALAINLLASYLTEFENGHIASVAEVVRLRDDAGEDLRSLTTSATEQDQPARRVIAAFEHRLQDTPELNLLCILGLFDRPISGGEFQAITAEPPIPGLTDKLLVGTGAGTGLILPAGASLVDRRFLERLRKLGLIAAESHHERKEIDAHPLIREHFAEVLEYKHDAQASESAESPQTHSLARRACMVDAAREAHRRLYEHLKRSAPQLPNNLNEMMPLYYAVAHGCKAGLWQDARRDVFRQRILRDNEFFAWRKLGAFGASLSALSGFFTCPWDELVDALDEIDTTFILSWTGYCLTAVGRLGETAAPMQAGLRIEIGEKCDWSNAAITASRLSELSLTLGDVSSAVRQGEQSVELADRSGDAFTRMASRTTLAAALFCAGAGRGDDVSGKALAAGSSETPDASAFRLTALSAFREAEAMQQERQPQYPLLYSLSGYRYCELLLADLGFRIAELKDANDAVAGGSKYVVERSPDLFTEPTEGLPDVGVEGRPAVDGVVGSGDPPTTERHPATTERDANDDLQSAIRNLQSEIEVVRRRAEKWFEWRVEDDSILDTGLGHLTLGRTWQLEAELKTEPTALAAGESGETDENTKPEASVFGSLQQAESHLNQSVTLLRQAGTQHHLPRGLLHRAALWRQRLEFTLHRAADQEDPPRRELQRNAERDLSEAETIAERGSMLIWQIEAALERGWLFLTLHHADRAGEAPSEPQHDDGTGGSAGASPSRWLDQAKLKLAEIRKLIEQTEKTYEPHVPDWEEWETPEYVGVFKKGEIVGYHCRNDEIERLERKLRSESP